ncbi:hypothetical protein [Streptomyces sp. ME19-01-6]|uniref:hypothetical protein n=1 Tax=Streptomyces sp. ME19-01-6 TaxID=3028686 RepID=UPI0029BD1631|nr:hypothetical protein [Streptomyces sp. ME19-01-6]MDX3228067.1 hypothetical protein [Streptomyces sp. ME19-01-6]
MGELLPFLMVVGSLAVVMGFFSWLAVLVRRRGVAGSAIRSIVDVYDQAWHATGHDSHYEIQVQAERKMPIPSPDDPWRPGRGVAAQAGECGGRPALSRPRAGRRGLGRRVRRLWHRR